MSGSLGFAGELKQAFPVAWPEKKPGGMRGGRRVAPLLGFWPAASGILTCTGALGVETGILGVSLEDGTTGSAAGAVGTVGVVGEGGFRGGALCLSRRQRARSFIENGNFVDRGREGGSFGERSSSRRGTTLHQLHNLIADFRIDAAQLVLDVDPVLLTKGEQVFALHVKLAGQNVDTDLFLRQAQFPLMTLFPKPPNGWYP